MLHRRVAPALVALIVVAALCAVPAASAAETSPVPADDNAGLVTKAVDVIMQLFPKLNPLKVIECV